MKGNKKGLNFIQNYYKIVAIGDISATMCLLPGTVDVILEAKDLPESIPRQALIIVDLN